MPKVALAALLLLPLMLGACAVPDLRGPMPMAAPRAAAPRATAPPAAPLGLPVGPLAPGGGPGLAPVATVTPGAAEAACVAAGAERGFQVRGVVGSSDVAGPGGAPVSRDVMLRVARGGQVFEVRCSYVYADGLARVMAL